MNIESIIRQLARSSYYQNLYSSSKETNAIHLFTNVNNHSGIQSLFLYWLRVYAMLYDDLANKEWPMLTEDVINDNIRCDAFLYYKRKKQEREINKYHQEKQKADMKVKDPQNTNLFNVDLRGK
jgi:hypothetical protein